MLEEVRDLRKLDLRQVARRFDRRGTSDDSLSIGTARIFASPPASSSIFSMPIGRQRTTTPVISGTGDSTRTSHGSPSSDSVWGCSRSCTDNAWTST